MGTHLHLKAVPEAGFREEFVWLEELFDAAYQRGFPTDEVEDLIEKDFFDLDHLVCGAERHNIVPEEPGSLLIFGGRPVYSPDGDHVPPYVVLDAKEVELAAGFVAATSFETLWEASGAELKASSWGWPEDEVREMFHAHYAGLREVYVKAAAGGCVMAKYFSF